MDEKKGGSYFPIIIVMGFSLLIASLWNKFPIIKESANAVLNPSAGFLLNWNLTWGMILIVFLLSLFTTLIQKYATDQTSLRELKKEQKFLQDEMKKYKEHPEKLIELQKKQWGIIPKTMELSMRAVVFTGVPLILLFRWFQDFFTANGNPHFFGFFSWFWFYFLGFLIFTSILRKYLDVV